MEQSFGLSHKEAFLLNNTLQNFVHYISTGYGISKRSYGRKTELLAGTGQGNILSGSICKNITCLIFKFLENNLLGFKYMSPVIRVKFMRTVIAFVDDADFYIGGENTLKRERLLIFKYNKMHAASAGKGQLAKNNFYFWKTKWGCNRNTVYIPKQDKIYVKGTEIKKLSISIPKKSLGVTTTPNNN